MATPFSNQTEAAKAGLNLTLTPVEQFVLDGLQRQIYEKLNLINVWISSPDEKDVALQRLFGTENQGAQDTKVKYPYAFLTLQSTKQLDTIGNVHALSVRGLVAAYDGDSTKGFLAKLIPTEFAVRLEYTTNSFKEVLAFSTLLLIAGRNGWLKFNVAYGRLTLSVGVQIEPSVSIPSKEGNNGSKQEYVLEANLTVQSYSSLPTLLEQQVVKQVDITADVQLQSEQGVNSATFWSWAPKSSEANDSTLTPGSVSRST